jgi:hypothetical protein
MEDLVEEIRHVNIHPCFAQMSVVVFRCLACLLVYFVKLCIFFCHANPDFHVAVFTGIACALVTVFEMNPILFCCSRLLVSCQ